MNNAAADNNTINTSCNNSENYLEPCEYTIRLINKLKSLNASNALDFELINKAIYWARKYHGQQMRKSGEPYYTHPLEVAYLISVHNRPTTNLIVTSILHDIIEDTEVTAGMIVDNFGFRIAEMTDALTRDRPDGTKLSVEEI
jgi:guanosine-3',5'-bis(diphosphate) 3'-pyrophosphohydrolase